jgi:hypothetical protein
MSTRRSFSMCAHSSTVYTNLNKLPLRQSLYLGLPVGLTKHLSPGTSIACSMQQNVQEQQFGGRVVDAKIVINWRCCHPTPGLRKREFSVRRSDQKLEKRGETFLLDTNFNTGPPNTRVIIGIEKREIKPKPPRRCRLRCPPPLLPAAPSRRQTSYQSLLSPPPVVAAPPRPRAPLKIVNHNRRQRRIRMSRNSFRSPLTGAPRCASKRWRAKKLRWMHLGAQEVMTRQILHNCWALHSVSATIFFPSRLRGCSLGIFCRTNPGSNAADDRLSVCSSCFLCLRSYAIESDGRISL